MIARAFRAVAQQVEPGLLERLEQLPNGRPEGRGVDPLGYDAEFLRDHIGPAIWIYRHYFRAITRGIENVPEGRVLLIGNHSGQIPWDGLMIAVAMLLETDKPRFVRGMADKWLPTIPFVAPLFERTGQLAGTPDNCRALLDRGEAVLAFPEGVRGICKPIQRRYQLQRFGHGFMRLAKATGTPVVPISVVGAEEQYVSVHNSKPVARMLGLPALPLMPQLLFPLVGALPLPTRYRIRFGEPLQFDDDDSDLSVAKAVSDVRAAIQDQMRHDLDERRSLFA